MDDCSDEKKSRSFGNINKGREQIIFSKLEFLPAL